MVVGYLGAVMLATLIVLATPSRAMTWEETQQEMRDMDEQSRMDDIQFQPDRIEQNQRREQQRMLQWQRAHPENR